MLELLPAVDVADGKAVRLVQGKAGSEKSYGSPIDAARAWVEQGATLGANCTIVCGTRIGKHAFVGAGAVVNRDVKPFALMVGVPAKQVGWMSAHGERVQLPLKGEGSWTCPHTGDAYQLLVDQLHHLPNSNRK